MSLKKMDLSVSEVMATVQMRKIMPPRQNLPAKRMVWRGVNEEAMRTKMAAWSRRWRTSRAVVLLSRRW